MSSWDNDDKTCYETALEIIDRAAQYIEKHDKGEATFGGSKFKALDACDTRGNPDRDTSLHSRADLRK
jgi:rhamnose utilization protein RhaD (predicted bifunctional aldolase and dehydrogenase)